MENLNFGSMQLATCVFEILNRFCLHKLRMEQYISILKVILIIFLVSLRPFPNKKNVASYLIIRNIVIIYQYMINISIF